MTTSLRSSLHGLALGQKPAPTDDDGEVLERIIVGIDFGTTHSAVAWAQTSSPEEYEVITHWPGQTSKDWGKVPSDILYPAPPISRAASPNEVGSPKLSASLSRPPSTGSELISSTALGFKWGFEVPPTDPQKLSWIKILLDPSQPRPTFVNPKRTTLPRGKKPVDVVTDYLTALRQYTEQTLERRLGRDLISRSQVEYVLTVPAVWSDKARQMTMEAAMRAGLGLGNGGGDAEASGGLLKLITEPEGAAEYALRSIQPNSVKVGDCFVVCDAGGGTVDLISYRISSLVPLQLNEVAIGTGALCGAVYLDRRFEDFIITRIGKEQFEAMDHRARFQMVQYWETYVKREFVLTDEDNDGSDDREGQAEGGEFWVPVMGVPDDDDRGVKGGFLKVARKDVRDIFEPVVSQVLELISKQVIEVLKSGKGPVAAILLVGGFGSSEYLYQRINKWGSGKITIMQPRNAWTAVVRGAIIRGLQGDIAAVQSRLSRRYYGVVHDSKFDETKHEENEKKWHELRCEWVVRNRIQWYIKRGDVTTEKKKISFPFYRTVAETDLIGDTHQLRTELWVCDEEVAPDKRDSTVRKLCVMTSEPVPVKRFSKHKNGKGQVFYRVDYTLDMTVTSGIVVYEMSLEGEEGTVGRVTTKYE
ncbi:uncharacterized protein H6S33_005442 [Morchella sextelata]|uniref:uncharacterized protein n=1 Tax=Morchella sextelata TaxID=1174677 RepID=UPI001D042B00|nr:uncharacterized protein H6S33_005442 [Morchella sextelata]KAH0613556.1 hypothetical protein H6S33_005442 [Morchella sextelata]